jgi:hypothetical protein
LVRDGTIPALRLGNRWVIPRARFHAWLDVAIQLVLLWLAGLE